MGWFWGFKGKKNEKEELLDEVDYETMFGDTVRVEVTDIRKGSWFFRGKIKDKKVRELKDDGTWSDSDVEYDFEKSKARRGFFRRGKKR